MRKFWVSFLNGSLKYHADVIAGRQFHQIRMKKYLMIDSHSQLIVKCCYPWNVWEKGDPAWGDHFISSRYCVSCRFCQNSFCHFYQPPCAPEEKFLVDIGEESPGIRVKFWNSLLLEIMAKLTKMWGKGRHRCYFWCSRVGDLKVWVAWFHFLRNCPEKKRTGGTDFFWVCCWHRSTSTMWIFKSSYLISFWFAGIIWRPLIFSIS